MIVESAFTILPEMIAGLGFHRVLREANAVETFAFSLLNALHSKNVVDPIQRIQLERSYSTSKLPFEANRHCDIFVDYGGSKIGSKELANFGWRFRNYVEAKFLKSYAKTNTGQDSNATKNSAEIIADLIRLVALVPEPNMLQPSRKCRTATARYFLALADSKPDVFLNKYLADLCKTFETAPRTAKIEIDLGARRTLSERVGLEFNGIKLCISHCTCFSHFPLDPSLSSSCWMLLLRIDSAKISLTGATGDHIFEIGLDRKMQEGTPGDYRHIREYVAERIK